MDNYPELMPGFCLGRNLTFAKHIVDKLIADGIPTGKGPSMDAPKAEEDLTAEGGADGTYTASAQGYAGPVPVTVEVEDGKIVSVSVAASGETAALGGAAAPVVAEAIKTANGVIGVDGVSGATMTSNAIKAAVNAALKQGK